jgi:hypothetical protein
MDSDLNYVFAILTNSSQLIFFRSSADDRASSRSSFETDDNYILSQNLVLNK